MHQKYRCIKDYYLDRYNLTNQPTFRSGEIYDGYDADIATRIWCSMDYVLKYKYPQSIHFMKLNDSISETYFIKLSEERNTKINQLFT